MDFEEAVVKSLPHFHEAIEEYPEDLILLGVISKNPFEPDGLGRTYVIRHPDKDPSYLKDLEGYVDVLYYYWRGYVICQDGRVWMSVPNN